MSHVQKTKKDKGQSDIGHILMEKRSPQSRTFHYSIFFFFKVLAFSLETFGYFLSKYGVRVR